MSTKGPKSPRPKPIKLKCTATGAKPCKHPSCNVDFSKKEIMCHKCGEKIGTAKMVAGEPCLCFNEIMIPNTETWSAEIDKENK